MDMKKYAGSAFIKIDDVKDGPIKGVIEDVVQGKYDRPDIVFEDGSKFGVNATNVRILNRAYGTDSDGWIGQRIELYEGEAEYQDNMVPSVCVRPISPPTSSSEGGTPAAKPKPRPKAKGGDMDDEIPFN
jgi:hypothetical protein